MATPWLIFTYWEESSESSIQAPVFSLDGFAAKIINSEKIYSILPYHDYFYEEEIMDQFEPEQIIDRVGELISEVENDIFLIILPIDKFDPVLNLVRREFFDNEDGVSINDLYSNRILNIHICNKSINGNDFFEKYLLVKIVETNQYTIYPVRYFLANNTHIPQKFSSELTSPENITLS